MADRSLLSPGKLLPVLSLLLFATLPVSLAQPPAEAAMMGSPSHHYARTARTVSRKRSVSRVTPLGRRNSRPTTKLARKAAAKKIAQASKRGKSHKVAQVYRVAPKAIPPQLYLEKLNQLTLRPGVVHKYCHGGLNVNVVEVDTTRADVKVRPYLASDSFDRLKTVEQHAKDSGALVAVNANYFKKDGTPLGTIKVDGEWVAGSLFDRVAMGITNDGDMQFARVNLHGILNTSNPNVPQLWVNNMNQPRRSGARLILYTRRWGADVRLAYDGTLVAVSNRGEVVDTSNRVLTIPYGGYVLTDRKQSELASLKRGDFVDLEWQTNPRNWNQVAHAVSGGPTLIKDGNLWVGLKE
ncbi:MAG: phosphodiester glycosidase family protein, partial [Candidatus Obscuribacterales bacterium]|nr:phosphodiester glycosidase family protein [Candidatus Obscuribacterales bacterium]